MFPPLPPDEDEEVIEFNTEDVPDPLPQPDRVRHWIRTIIARQSAQLRELQYIFCSDDYLYRLNVEHLQHDTLTDIITFPYTDPPVVHGDIFISTERVRENAEELQVSFDEELRRVIIHGVLHLCGFSDKTEADSARMRELEDEALGLWAEVPD